MVWFFARCDQTLQIETRYDNDTSEYVGIIRHPDGHQEVQRFTDPQAYGDWLGACERGLLSDRWKRDGVEILLNGWPNRRLT
jgi:hypothetical protein